jgi:flagellar motor switch protein FliG
VENEPAGIELDETLAHRISFRTIHVDDEPAAQSAAETAPFRFLHEADSPKLARILQTERPQTIALIISHLPRHRAGEMLESLPEELQVDIVRRLVDLDDTNPDILRDVERGLESRLSEQVRTQRRQTAGLAAVAEILDAADRLVGIRILNNLANHDRQLAARLGHQRLEFDDLARLDDYSLATVFQAAGAELSLVALTGSTPRLIERVLRRLSPTEAASLRDQLNHPQPVRLRDVEQAREEVAQLARNLAVEGRIDLPETTKYSFNASV